MTKAGPGTSTIAGQTATSRAALVRSRYTDNDPAIPAMRAAARVCVTKVVCPASSLRVTAPTAAATKMRANAPGRWEPKISARQTAPKPAASANSHVGLRGTVRADVTADHSCSAVGGLSAKIVDTRGATLPMCTVEGMAACVRTVSPSGVNNTTRVHVMSTLYRVPRISFNLATARIVALVVCP